ncbi:hypothetical protein Tco_0767490 [Tanacetum coccineum]
MGKEVVTCKLYLGLAFIIPTLERVTIGCYEVGGGGGVVVGVGVVYGDGVDRGVGGVDCGVVKAPVSMMIVSVPEKDIWCGARGKFVWWKGVRVTKASERANVGVRVNMSNDDGSNLVGGGFSSNPDKADEPTTGHVKDGDTLTKDGSCESDGSYTSTFPAQGCKKENSKFELDHVSPYMDDVEHVNDHCTSQGIEVSERSLSSQLGGQVGSSKPRPLENIIAYSWWLNENDSIKGICEGFISGKYASSSHGNNIKHSHSTFTKSKTCGAEENARMKKKKIKPMNLFG